MTAKHSAMAGARRSRVEADSSVSGGSGPGLGSGTGSGLSPEPEALDVSGASPSCSVCGPWTEGNGEQRRKIKEPAPQFDGPGACSCSDILTSK